MTPQAAFAAMLNMSATAAITAVAVVVLNMMLKRAKAPAALRSALWLVVLFRLLCPVSFTAAWSPLALLPAVPSSGVSAPAETSSGAVTAPIAAAPTGGSIIIGEDMPQLYTTAGMSASPAAAAAPPNDMPLPGHPCLPYLWAAGAIALLVYSAASYALLKRRLAMAVRVSGNIYASEHVHSPFVCGFFRPRIYLPPGLSGAESAYIIRHEQIHIRRRDHLVKPLMYAACCLHWFNPLAWLSFYLMSRDMEFSCDEAVLREMGAAIKADYSGSLLALASRGRFFAPSPLAFGETGVKERVRRALAYQKPVVWVTALAAVAVLICAVILLANPRADMPEEPGLEAQELGLDTVDEEERDFLRQNSIGANLYLTSRSAVHLDNAAMMDTLCTLLATGRPAETTPGNAPPVADYLRVFLWEGGNVKYYFVYEQEGRYFIDRPYLSRQEIGLETYDTLLALYQQAVLLKQRESRFYYGSPVSGGYSSHSLMRSGGYATAARRYLLGDEIELANQVAEGYLLADIFGPALRWEQLQEQTLYTLSISSQNAEPTTAHYQIFQLEGVPYIQKDYEDCRHLDEELFARLTALLTGEDVKDSQRWALQSQAWYLSSLMLLRQAVLDLGLEEDAPPPGEWYARQRDLPQGMVVLSEEAIIFDATAGEDMEYHEGAVCLLPRYYATTAAGERQWASSGQYCVAYYTVTGAGKVLVEKAQSDAVSLTFSREEDGYFFPQRSWGMGSASPLNAAYLTLPENETILAALSPQLTEILTTANVTALQDYIEQLVRQYAAEQGWI